jgi:hypothetical protein
MISAQFTGELADVGDTKFGVIAATNAGSGVYTGKACNAAS